MTEPGLAAIRAAAPGWAKFLCGPDYWTPVFWQDSIGGCVFGSDRPTLYSGRQWKLIDGVQFRSEPWAIELATESVYLQQPDGSILEVTRKEWDV